MSLFNQYKTVIEEGDLVLLYISRDNIKPIKVAKNDMLNTRYGSFAHNDMIGSLYGSQITSPKGYGFIHLLHPTPELWTLSLPHRTQIVYTPDSSYIQQRLGITRGSRMIEAGTGSGSFTHSCVRTCGPEGQVYSFEFHEPRFLELKQEFTDHNLTNVEITHRDVCKDGFTVNDQMQVEAIFLDLPLPWEAIEHLNSVISTEKQAGICCFSPCIEQVFKSITLLTNNGWINIETVEIAGRKYELRKEMVKDIDDVLGRLKDIKRRKAQGVQDQKAGKVLKKQEHKQDFNPFGKGQRVKEGDELFKWVNVTKIELEIKSHTSYLTFAYKIPNTV